MANKKYHKPVKKTRKPPITRQEPPRNSTTNPAAAAAIPAAASPSPSVSFQYTTSPEPRQSSPHDLSSIVDCGVLEHQEPESVLPAAAAIPLAVIPWSSPPAGPTPDPGSSESSVRNVPPAVFELVVLENLHPENHRLGASALARVNRGRYQLLRSIINKVLVSREQKGKSRRDLDVEFERMMKTDGKGGLVR